MNFYDRMSPLTTPTTQMNSTDEEERSLFLGDLSWFCQDANVIEFFRNCGPIEGVRLIRSKTTNKCLGYGFVTFQSIDSLPLAMRLYGQVFIGRKIKIGLANPRKTSPVSAKIAAFLKGIEKAQNHGKDNAANTAQVHFSYISQNGHKLVTEETIRNVFINFGDIDDIALKKANIDYHTHAQSGYGFIHFLNNEEGIQSAVRATSVIRQVVLDGVLFDSCLTRSVEALLRQRNGLPPGHSSRRHFHPVQSHTRFSPESQYQQRQMYPVGAPDFAPPAPVRERSYQYEPEYHSYGVGSSPIAQREASPPQQYAMKDETPLWARRQSETIPPSIVFPDPQQQKMRSSSILSLGEEGSMRSSYSPSTSASTFFSSSHSSLGLPNF